MFTHDFLCLIDIFKNYFADIFCVNYSIFCLFNVPCLPSQACQVTHFGYYFLFSLAIDAQLFDNMGLI